MNEKNKKTILNKMEKLLKNSYSRNLEEFNSKDLFNSSCEPITYVNISNMVDNLRDDINNLTINIKDDLNNIKSKYDSANTNLNDFNRLIQINQQLFESQLSLILFPFSQFKNVDYLGNLVNYQINRSDEILKKALEELITPINNNYFEYLSEISSEMILSTFNTLSGQINNQSKVITTEDNEIYELIINNIDNVDTILDIIVRKKIFEKIKEIRDYVDADSIVETLKYEATEFGNGFEDLKHDISVGFQISNGKWSITPKKCWSIDIIQKFANDTFPLKLVAPSFPFLQIRFWPNVILQACISAEFEDDFEWMSSQLTFDISCGAKIILTVEGGLYFDLGVDLKKKKYNIADLKVVVEVEGTLFDGKVGMKFSIDFMQAKLILTFYLDISAFSFRFYFKVSFEIKKLFSADLANESITLKGIEWYNHAKVTCSLRKAECDKKINKGNGEDYEDFIEYF